MKILLRLIRRRMKLESAYLKSVQNRMLIFSSAFLLLFGSFGSTLWAQSPVRIQLKDSTANNPARPLDTIFYRFEIQNLSDTTTLRHLQLTRSGDPNTMIIGGFQSTPIAIPAQATNLLEDTPDTLHLQGLDPDGDALFFGIAQPPTRGVLSNLTGISLNRANILYTPNEHFSGEDEFTFFVADDDGNQDTSIFKITVRPINDPPAFTAADSIIVLEDAGLQNLMWAENISAGPPDESGQTLTFDILSNDQLGLFDTLPRIATDGTLTFATKADSNGMAILFVQLKDNGGTDNGGVDTSARQALRIVIIPVNDAPNFTKGANISIETTTNLQTFANWATNITAGPPDEAEQMLTFVVEVTENEALFEALPQITADGTLRFQAKPNAVGMATVAVQLKDDGGADNGGADTSSLQSFTIKLKPAGE